MHLQICNLATSSSSIFLQYKKNLAISKAADAGSVKPRNISLNNVKSNSSWGQSSIQIEP
jgi:hypothetical protein